MPTSPALSVDSLGGATDTTDLDNYASDSPEGATPLSTSRHMWSVEDDDKTRLKVFFKITKLENQDVSILVDFGSFDRAGRKFCALVCDLIDWVGK